MYDSTTAEEEEKEDTTYSDTTTTTATATTTTTTTPPTTTTSSPSSYSTFAWETQFRDLQAFHLDYGHVNVPQHPPGEIQQKYPRLAHFCKNQRSIYKNCTDEDYNNNNIIIIMGMEQMSPELQDRMERLKALGFDFDVRQSAWDIKYYELEAYWKQHGHLAVSKKEGPDLYNWMHYQRRRYNKAHDDKYKPLTDDQVQRLEAIGFCWNPKEQEWWKNYHALKLHKEQHGHLTVSDSKLRSWKNSLRRTCREYVLAVYLEEDATDDIHVSGLNAERLEALRELDFCWLPDQDGVLLLEKPPDDIFYGYQ